MQWSPGYLFALTYTLAALSALGLLFLSSRTLSFRFILGTIFVYGGMGASLGMFIYEYLGGRQAPWKVVAIGILVGVGAVKKKDVTNFLRRILNTDLKEEK